MRAKTDIGVVLAGIALFAAVAALGAAATRAAMGVGVPLPPMSQSAEAAPSAAADAPASASEEADAATPSVPPSTGVAPSQDARLQAEVLSMAVKRAPFDPDRRAPTRRYLLPDQIEPPRREQPPPQRPAPPQFRILGTVVAPAGSVAVVQLADGKKRVMTVGQEMEGYRVSAIEQGAVVMSGQGWDLTFAVADAQPIGPNRPQRDASGRIIQDRAQQNRGQQNAAQQARGQLLELERALTNLQIPAEARANLGVIYEDVVRGENGPTWIVGPNGRLEAGAPPTPEMIYFRRPTPPGGGG